jgi:hypothetical protein
MVSHGVVPQKFPEVLDWVVEQDKGENIDFPVESVSEDDDDDDEDYDYSLNAEHQRRVNSRFRDLDIIL